MKNLRFLEGKFWKKASFRLQFQLAKFNVGLGWLDVLLMSRLSRLFHTVVPTYSFWCDRPRKKSVRPRGGVVSSLLSGSKTLLATQC